MDLITQFGIFVMLSFSAFIPIAFFPPTRYRAASNGESDQPCSKDSEEAEIKEEF